MAEKWSKVPGFSSVRVNRAGEVQQRRDGEWSPIPVHVRDGHAQCLVTSDDGIVGSVPLVELAFLAWPPRARLTTADVRRIRKLLASGNLTNREIGRRLGVDESTVRQIGRGDTWKHVEID